MDIFFVPRQPEDPECLTIGMYYNTNLDRMSFCDIEAALEDGHSLTINKASQKFIKDLIAANFPPPFLGITDDNKNPA